MEGLSTIMMVSLLLLSGILVNMLNVMRVALPGYNALTDTDPSHFSLFTDSDNILIKEKTRSSTTVNASSTVNVPHGLSYIPYVLVYVSEGAKRIFATGNSIVGSYDYQFTVTGTNIVLRNNTGTNRTFNYYIFYDQQA